MLTKEDWEEIYYALEYKRWTHPAVVIDKQWQAHIKYIMDEIGPDGEYAHNEYQGVKG
jgi:hypothetical protein